jgi:hypothetical protein
MGHAVAHPINTATAVKDGVLAVRDGIGELSSALDAGHVTWGEIGTAYGDGLTEVASDPAKVGKIVGGSAVSLGVGKAAAVGGKLAMAAVVQTNTARTVAVSAVLATTELAPVASGAARSGAIAAQVGTAFAKGAAAAKTPLMSSGGTWTGNNGGAGLTYDINFAAFESAQANTILRNGGVLSGPQNARQTISTVIDTGGGMHWSKNFGSAGPLHAEPTVLGGLPSGSQPWINNASNNFCPGHCYPMLQDMNALFLRHSPRGTGYKTAILPRPADPTR